MNRRAVSRADVERELPELATEIAALTVKLNAAHARKLGLWKAGVLLSPRMRHHELAKLSRVRTVTVSGALAEEKKQR